ncbi:MAG TPA: hypothetical protein VME43_07565 [Bryobacteraceae bacterium]|nr:hypothetical protein [Bryobacteraceae bacterium]
MCHPPSALQIGCGLFDWIANYVVTYEELNVIVVVVPTLGQY